MKIGASKLHKNLYRITSLLTLLILIIVILLTNCKAIKTENDNKQAPEWLKATSYPQGQIIISEDFESGGWDESFWTRNWCEFSYSCQIVNNPSGGGKVFRSVYNPNNCSSSERSTMGDELNSPSLPYDEHWLGVRIYFDSKQFGPDSNSMSLVQYHGKPDFDQGERWRDAISMLRYRFGELYMSYIGSKHRVTPYENGKHVYTERDSISLGKPKLDAWNTFVFHIKWDPTGDNGTLEIGMTVNTTAEKTLTSVTTMKENRV